MSDRETIRSALRWAHAELRRAGVAEARLAAETLLAHALERERLELYLHPQRPVPAERLARFRELIARRAQGVPTQHLVGEVSFLGHPLKVNGAALVPRFETEQLVERALERLPTDGRFLDAGTGTGAIAIALALARPRARGVALDCAREALALARENAERNGVLERLTFVQGDWLAELQETFDLVVANPPYVPHDQLERLPPEVRHDPRVALDGGADGLEHVRTLIDQAGACLVPGGWLVLEVGDGQAERVRGRLEAAGYAAVRGYEDLNGVERFVEGRWEGTWHASSRSRS